MDEDEDVQQCLNEVVEKVCHDEVLGLPDMEDEDDEENGEIIASGYIDLGEWRRVVGEYNLKNGLYIWKREPLTNLSSTNGSYSNSGNAVFEIEDTFYSPKRVRKTDNVTVCRCSVKNCRSKLFIHDLRYEVKGLCNHGILPEWKRIRSFLRNAKVQRASGVPVATCVSNVILKCSDEELQIVPSKAAMRKQVQRPMETKYFRGLHDKIDWSSFHCWYYDSIDDEDFEQSKRLLIFRNDSVEPFRDMVKHVYADGKFLLKSGYFSQLYVIVAEV
ncbi:unnamed protein product [Caenorhabditis auriculariae]|uniref:Uncharacterized protein n=1 Tax=Caenorhabditis auriculariae TaxID=2777116 RepID=A0A8S1GQN0_9PELO|nr:unnamed protein product [Caenorhabditis auriculariae]